MADRKLEKRIEQAEYRAKLIEAELNAVRSSKAYQLSKKAGIIKAQVVSDPVGLSKKAARMILTNPSKARHMFRSASRGAFIAQSVVEQAAKYQEWILLNEPDEAELDEQREAGHALKIQPKISIITPVFNPPVDVLDELIESVLEQTYTNFELCLGNFGDNEDVKQLLVRYADLDKRIKVYEFGENKGISYNSNLILGKATGEYIALLDHDDTLSADALYENIKLINELPYDFIYSDKDKIDEAGNRFDPLFKPKLSPEMLLNINYLTHLNIMRTSIVREVGAWDSNTDGAQDWDIFLKVIAASKHIGHIPKVLYHWRVIASSTAMSIDSKPYALAAQCKAVDKYMEIEDIPASAYIVRTELFLRWQSDKLDQSPLIILEYSNLTNTARIIRHIKKAVKKPDFVIIMSDTYKDQAKHVGDTTGYPVLVYGKDSYASTLGEFIASHKSHPKQTALFILDNIRLSKNTDWYENLTGWLAINDVAAACGRLVDRSDLIISSGGIITPGGDYFPVFQHFPRYYQSYIGNAEWVRDLSILAPHFFATTVDSLKEFDFINTTMKTKQDAFDSYFLKLSAKKRLVMTPHATASVFESPNLDNIHPVKELQGKKEKFLDPFGNINMSVVDPMRLFDDEIIKDVDKNSPIEPVDRYQYDATILASTFDVSPEELTANKKVVDSQPQISNPKSVLFIVPGFEVMYAGIMNIFSFADYLSQNQNLKIHVAVLTGNDNPDTEQAAIVKSFPKLNSANFMVVKPDNLSKLPTVDIAIATQWATAYILVKHNDVKRKCYFIQDNESNFYPKGSVSALVDLTYSFGFTAIANTPGLLTYYKSAFGGSGIAIKSKVDLSVYHPRKDMFYNPKPSYKVFFYARPNMPRNAFELGIAGLKKLKQELGDKVEVITAGAPWESADYGVEGLFVNLGKIDYDAVPKLYRSVDAGLMFMFSGHPGVTASELMASGCPVVVNDYPDETWHELYKHEETCLVSGASASQVSAAIRRCLTDNTLRKKLIEGGLAKSRNFYDGYDDSLKAAYKFITD